MRTILRIASYLAAAFVAAVLGLIAFVAFLGTSQPERIMLPPPTGPYAVGREGFDWMDPNREDPFAPATGVKRELTGWIWYPAMRGTEGAAEYVAPALARALHEAGHPLVRNTIGRLQALIATDLLNVTSHALDRPVVAGGEEQFPVVLLKPGRGGLVVQYSTLAEDLASHGYVVVGSDSPYTTPVVMHADGKLIARTPRGAPPEMADGRKSDLAPGQPNDLAVPVIKVWAEDNRFLLDRLREGGAKWRADLGAVGALGHSYGGAAALEYCAIDERCSAGVNLDGALWGTAARDGLKKPFLFFFSDRPIFREVKSDSFSDALTKIRAGLPNRPNMIVLRGSQHYNFADAALMTEPRVGRFIGQTGEIDPVRALELARQYVRAFFDTHLKNRPDALIKIGAPEVELSGQ